MQAENKSMRIVKLEASDQDEHPKSSMPADRLAMIWQLTLDAWALKGDSIADDFRHDVVRVIRLEDK
jgi:hypothetical protein